MTPEKFREWIIILFAVLIVTIWVGMATRLCKVGKYSDAATRRGAMTRQMPRRMPTRTRPTKRRKLPAKQTEKLAPKPAEKK